MKYPKRGYLCRHTNMVTNNHYPIKYFTVICKKEGSACVIDGKPCRKSWYLRENNEKVQKLRKTV